jgi:hypothetical protein
MTLDEPKRPRTLGEKVSTWAKAIAVLAASGIAVYGAMQGTEAKDDADDNLVQLSEQVTKQNNVINKQSAKLEKLKHQMAFYEGHQAGFSAGKLYEQKEDLSKRLDKCFSRRIPRSVTAEKLVEILRSKRTEQRKLKPRFKSGKPIQKLAPMHPYRNGKK